MKIVDIAGALFLDTGGRETEDYTVGRFRDQHHVSIPDLLRHPPTGHDVAERSVEKVIGQHVAVGVLPTRSVNSRNGIPISVSRGSNHWRSSAATPGSVRPSIHSRN